MFPILKKASEYGQPTAYVKHVNPEAGQFVAPWAQLEQKEQYLLDNPTQNIKAISLVVSDKKIFKVFEIFTHAI